LEESRPANSVFKFCAVSEEQEAAPKFEQLLVSNCVSKDTPWESAIARNRYAGHAKRAMVPSRPVEPNALHLDREPIPSNPSPHSQARVLLRITVEVA